MKRLSIFVFLSVLFISVIAIAQNKTSVKTITHKLKLRENVFSKLALNKNKILSSLEELDLIKEYTSFRKNRKFIFNKYLESFNR